MGYLARLPTLLGKHLNKLPISLGGSAGDEAAQCVMECGSQKYLKYVSGYRARGYVWYYKHLWYIPIANNATGFYRYMMRCIRAWRSDDEWLRDSIWSLLQPMACYGSPILLHDCMKSRRKDIKKMIAQYGNELVRLAMEYYHSDTLEVMLQLGVSVSSASIYWKSLSKGPIIDADAHLTDPSFLEERRFVIEFLTPLMEAYPDLVSMNF